MELQWPLILFTLFVAWAAGLFAVQAVYALRGQAAKAQMPAIITSAALLAIGGIAVFTHLQHWERIFNGFGHITSGITQELIAVVIMGIVMVVYFVYLHRSGDEPAVPSWAAVLAIVVSAALAIVMAHSYMMASRPTWDTFLWVCAIVGSACVLGPATFVLIASIRGEGSALDGPVVLAGSVLNAVCSGAYLAYLASVGGRFMQVEYCYDLTHPTHGMQSYANPFMDGSAVLVWIGVVAVGMVVPIICAVLGRKRGNWSAWGTAALVCALIGTVCLRVVFYQTGQSVFMFY